MFWERSRFYFKGKIISSYIYPFKWSRYHPMVQKFYCERYLSIQSMLGKKEKKYQHFNIFDYTYLPKTDICLFFFFFFYEPFPYDITRSLGALWAPTSSWRPFGPLDIVLRALRPLRPCDPRTHVKNGDERTKSWIFGVGWETFLNRHYQVNIDSTG